MQVTSTLLPPTRSATPAAATKTGLAGRRLALGISCVGTIVLLSSASLLAGFPQWLAARLGTGFGADFLTVAVFVGMYVVVSSPFDLLGRRLVPAASVDRPDAADWLRGAAWQAGLYLAFAALLLAAGQLAGRVGAVLVFGGLMFLLVALQLELASRVAGSGVWPRRSGLALPRRAEGPLPLEIRIFDNLDAGFTGGTAGVPGRERVVLPARWLELLSEASLDTLATRYESIIRSGSHRRGILVAGIWNTFGFTLASFLPGAGFESAAALLTTTCGFTLWSFLGLLLLPTLSRSAVRAADRRALRAGATSHSMRQAIAEVREMTENDHRRSRGVESIFHPVPAPDRRAVDESSKGPQSGPWHVARTALFLTWAGLGLLPRAVHCNCGRPELWVLLPAE